MKNFFEQEIIGSSLPKALFIMKGLLILFCMVLIAITMGYGSEPIGGGRDEGGCYVSAGYQWCEKKGRCIRPWEEDCDDGE